MTMERLFEIILAAVKANYGEQFESLNQKEKQNIIMIMAGQLTQQNPEIMQAIAEAAYIELAY